ncbi:hypothetical protein RAC89_03885 [Paenibacillus sp. GD4]|uniref:hypothetical protein n=1 Tax=Paenibacillus sp. GD4 TaxID=3068890 RepID=UPI002796D1B3|nr:hypothetical protein [Paenibacillus sp. GD4]MDQ1909646.1 hypothetical protein [Paenibacillus sp. GD4]
MEDNVYRKLVKMNDDHVRTALANQVTDPGSRYFGGVISEATGVPSPTHGGTAGYMAGMASALVCPDSEFYHDTAVAARLEWAADYMLNKQHSDGTISLGSTNYHSPPDTGFVITGFGQLYRLLESQPWQELRGVEGKIKLFLGRAIPAMLTGGCHTPNHRWVLTSALAWLYDIFRLEALVERADEWLAEGLDCTEDGEWTERSHGIYNTVNDIMLYHTARLLKREELLDPVRRNLEMMTYLVHPNGDVVTEYSERQDVGQRADLSEYFLVYRLMAAHDRNPLFAAMSDLAADHLSRLGPVNNHALLGYLLFPQTKLTGLERAELPTSYTKVINEHHPVAEDLLKRRSVGHHDKIQHSAMHLAFGSPVVRHREGDTSTTIVTRAPSFFSIRHGEVSLLGTQMYTSFTPGLVEMEQFQRADHGYRMWTEMEKGYHGPVPKVLLPESAAGRISPWYLLPHHKRPVTHLQKHRLQVEVTRQQDSWQLHILGDDLPDVFTQVAFSFGLNGMLRGDGLQELEKDAWFWSEGSIRLEAGGDWMELTGGAHEHRIKVLRVNPVRPGIRTVLVNLITPFDHTFTLRLS